MATGAATRGAGLGRGTACAATHGARPRCRQFLALEMATSRCKLCNVAGADTNHRLMGFRLRLDILYLTLIVLNVIEHMILVALGSLNIDIQSSVHV